MLLNTTTNQTLQIESNPFSKMNCRVRPTQIRVKPKVSELQDYDLGETIGQGGFGFVRKAVHIPSGEKVAVKICSIAGCQLSQIRSIEREIELQRYLLHQNIAQIYEVIKTNSRIYIFMEYCKNGELFDRINRSGPMPERQAAKVFHQILSALIYLRQNNVSHRDIKPENIMFDKHWNVKLIDFGFSCNNSQGVFRKTVCGTPSYIPPQIIKRQPYDAELADVWCLGVTLYAMLAAKLPFDAETSEKRKMNILTYKYTPQQHFTPRAQRLIASIFVEAQYRPKLQDLLNFDFTLAYEFPQAMKINFKHDKLELESSVVSILEREGFNADIVTKNVKSCQFNKYRALYFLTLKKQQKVEPSLHLTPFKRQRKSSTFKLLPIISTSTPQTSRKHQTQIPEQQIFTMKRIPLSNNKKYRDFKVNVPNRIDPSKARLRRNSIDSPRRLLDCLAAYKD